MSTKQESSEAGWPWSFLGRVWQRLHDPKAPSLWPATREDLAFEQRGFGVGIDPPREPDESKRPKI